MLPVSSAPLKWRIYYGDGSTFSNIDGPPEQSPGLNVQVIVQEDPEVGRHLLTSYAGIYWFEENNWFACMDQMGLGMYDYLIRPGKKIVRFGRTMLVNQEFRDIFARAAEDSDFTRKSGWKPGEKPHWCTWS